MSIINQSATDNTATMLVFCTQAVAYIVLIFLVCYFLPKPLSNFYEEIQSLDDETVEENMLEKDVLKAYLQVILQLFFVFLASCLNTYALYLFFNTVSSYGNIYFFCVFIFFTTITVTQSPLSSFLNLIMYHSMSNLKLIIESFTNQLKRCISRERNQVPERVFFSHCWYFLRDFQVYEPDSLFPLK